MKGRIFFAGLVAAFLAVAISPAAAQEEPEFECDEFDPPLDEEVIADIEDNEVSDETEFECQADWLRTEGILQPLLPMIGEPALGSYDNPEGIDHTIAMRRIGIAYGGVSDVESVICHFTVHPRYRFQYAGVRGTARFVRFWGAGADQERGNWLIDLTGADCDFLLETMEVYEPGDIVQMKPPADPIGPNGEIILVHGRVFYEFLDESGFYGVKLRPGLSRPAEPESEEAEKILAMLLRYFASKAMADGEKTELPSTDD